MDRRVRQKGGLAAGGLFASASKAVMALKLTLMVALTNFVAQAAVGTTLTSWGTAEGTWFFAWLFVAIAMFVLAAAVLVMVKRPGKSSGGLALGGVIALVVAFGIAPLLAVSTPTPGPAPPAATVQAVYNTGYSQPSGVTWVSAQNTLYVTLVYNSTHNYYAISNTVAGTASLKTYVNLPFKFVRTDTINTTYSFPATLTSIMTSPSLGSSPVSYSYLGYTAATGTTVATWQTHFTCGTLSGLNPSGSAPATTTNLITTGVPVTSFGSTSCTFTFTLAGTNSTSAPSSWASAVGNFSSSVETYTLSFGNAVPGAFYIQVQTIGWHA